MPRTAILIVNGFDRRGRWGPFNAEEAVKYPWIRLCLEQIERCTSGNDCRVLVWDNSGLPEHRELLERHLAVEVFRDEEQRRFRHARALDQLAARIPSGTEVIVTLDTDSFPISEGWLEELVRRLDDGAAIAGTWRDEMSPWIDPYIHPSCLAIRPDTFRELATRFTERHGAQDVGQGITKQALAAGMTVSGLRRSNAVDVHFLMGGVYDDLVYHHGAGSRAAQFWLSRDQERDEQTRAALRDAAFEDLDGLIALLRGELPPENAQELGLVAVPRGSRGTLKRQTTRVHKMLLMRRIHIDYEPRTYLEIGIRHGNSLALSRARTIGVDPAYEIRAPLACDVRLFRERSDVFFARRDGLKHFPDGRLDLAFIDGMHHFEFALRDFMNVERHCDWTSVVIVDDPLPRSRLQASRTRVTDRWAGDVYKLTLALQRHRPDLLVLPLDTSYAGSLLVLGLDPENGVLSERYDEIVREFEHPDPQLVPHHILTRESAYDPISLPEDLWLRLKEAREAGVPREEGWEGVRRSIEESIRAAKPTEPVQDPPRAIRAAADGGGPTASSEAWHEKQRRRRERQRRRERRKLKGERREARREARLARQQARPQTVRRRLGLLRRRLRAVLRPSQYAQGGRSGGS